MNWLLLIALYLLASVGAMKMFAQMGLDAWLALVPGLNLYLLVKKTWNPTYFWIMAVLAAFTALLSMVYTRSGEPLTITLTVVEAALLCMILDACIHTAQAFGKGTGTGVLVFLFPFIMNFYLGTLKYQGEKVRLSPVETAEMKRLQLLH